MIQTISNFQKPLALASRPQAFRPAVMAASLPMEPVFAGKTPEAGSKRTLFSRLMLMAAMLIPAGAAIAPSAHAQSPVAPGRTEAIQKEADAAKGPRTPGDANIDETIHPFVNTASDLPLLNGKMKQPIVDLARNPLLSEGTRQELTTMLNQFNNSQVGQVAVVIIPDTHRTELNTLATELFNQIGIGHAGKNDGTLLLVNAAAAREGRAHGKTFLMPGTALSSKLGGEKAAMLIKKHALPHLQNKDYDAAVRDTVKAITDIMKAESPEAAQKLLDGDQKTTQGLTNGEIVAICVVAAIVVLLLVALIYAASKNNRGGGGGGGGFIFIPDFSGPSSSGSSGGGFGDVIGGIGDAIGDFAGGIADGVGGGD